MAVQLDKDDLSPTIFTIQIFDLKSDEMVLTYRRIIDQLALELYCVVDKAHLILFFSTALPSMAESLSILAYAEEQLPPKIGLIVLIADDLEEIFNMLTPMLVSSPLTQKLYVAKSLKQARELILALHDQTA